MRCYRRSNAFTILAKLQQLQTHCYRTFKHFVSLVMGPIWKIFLHITDYKISYYNPRISKISQDVRFPSRDVCCLRMRHTVCFHPLELPKFCPINTRVDSSFSSHLSPFLILSLPHSVVNRRRRLNSTIGDRAPPLIALYR